MFRKYQLPNANHSDIKKRRSRCFLCRWFAVSQMDEKQLTVVIWKRYEAYDLEIVSSLASEYHKFEFDGFPI